MNKENNKFFTVFLGVKVKEEKFPWNLSASDEMKRILNINEETEEAFLEELIKALEDESTNPNKEIYENWSSKYSVESV
ncbi:hypothetical protein [Priestia megaterium]|uniref:Uncharacterized protein n=1 Tax=Priestia megaterium TaxID=1404 RepID=A0A6M6E3M9_PRIMG|nr:hypothetical protein [Priestia megaterium]QJX80234.1 hypothetical protein FDZ14_29495 [Priestia megaterium]